MTPSGPNVLSRSLNFLTAAALLVVAPAAFAQLVPQVLSVAFVPDTPISVPLSDWLTAGIALLLGAMAIFTLRRQTTRGGRLSGWVLAIVGGTMLFAATGQRILSDAQAIVPGISLTISPGTVSLPFSLGSPLGIVATNNTGQSVRITAITLDRGPYSMFTPTTCSVGLVLPPSGTCTITLSGTA